MFRFRSVLGFLDFRIFPQAERVASIKYISLELCLNQVGRSPGKISYQFRNITSVPIMQHVLWLKIKKIFLVSSLHFNLTQGTPRKAPHVQNEIHNIQLLKCPWNEIFTPFSRYSGKLKSMFHWFIIFEFKLWSGAYPSKVVIRCITSHRITSCQIFPTRLPLV